MGRVLVALTPCPRSSRRPRRRARTSCSSTTPLSSIHKALDTCSYPGDLLARAIRNGLALYARTRATTPPPRASRSPWQERSVSAARCEVLSPRESLRKLVVFVPEENVGRRGAGARGGWCWCDRGLHGMHFQDAGDWHLPGGDETNPYLGEKGRLEKVDEVRLETVVPAHAAGRATDAATAAHPYEEVALDVYPVEGSPAGCGYGRLGTLPEPVTPEELQRARREIVGFPLTPRRGPGTADRERRRPWGIGRLLRPRSSSLGRPCLRHGGRRLPRRVAR